MSKKEKRAWKSFVYLVRKFNLLKKIKIREISSSSFYRTIYSILTKVFNYFKKIKKYSMYNKIYWTL